MKLNKKGTIVVKNFLSNEEVKYLNNLKKNIVSWSWEDESRADLRLFGAERLDEIFFEKLSKKINNIFFSITSQNHVNTWMLNITKGLDNSKGSGGGWHRDDPLWRQYKFIIYLTDVSTNNGPFQYVLKSNSFFSRFTSLLINWFPKMRFNQDEIKGQIKEFTGNAGDLIISDTCGIHRGKPLEDGENRVALTSYSYSKNIPNNILKLSIQGEIHHI